MERLPRGERGAKGDKGEQGMPAGQRRAIIYLFLLNFALFLVLGVALFHSQARQQAEQRQAGLVIERKLCRTFGSLAANQPPPGNAVKNPSRAYDQRNHAILAQIGPDLDCNAIRKAGSR
jgi:hypothetical protein